METVDNLEDKVPKNVFMIFSKDPSKVPSSIQNCLTMKGISHPVSKLMLSN